MQQPIRIALLGRLSLPNAGNVNSFKALNKLENKNAFDAVNDSVHARGTELPNGPESGGGLLSAKPPEFGK
jgi:hypothetical protein